MNYQGELSGGRQSSAWRPQLFNSYFFPLDIIQRHIVGSTLSGEQFCHFQVCLPFQGCQLLKEKIGSTRRKCFSLTLKEPITTAADDIHKYFFIFFFF